MYLHGTDHRAEEENDKTMEIEHDHQTGWEKSWISGYAKGISGDVATKIPLLLNLFTQRFLHSEVFQ